MQRESPFTQTHTHTHHWISLLGVKGGRERRVPTTTRFPADCVCIIFACMMSSISTRADHVNPFCSYNAGVDIGCGAVCSLDSVCLICMCNSTDIVQRLCSASQKPVQTCMRTRIPFGLRVSQVYCSLPGNDYFSKKEGEAARSGRSRKIGTAVD